MRDTLVPWLRCPECQSPLHLRDAVCDGPHVMEGALHCQASDCARSFPIVRGVPRLLPDALRNAGPGEFGDLQRRTQRSFGYQWTRFGELRPEFEKQFLWFISPPITRGFFPGKRGIDAGCGFGRHMYWAAQWGAEVIGIDVSAAVDRAFANTAHLERAHVVQGDIFSLPLARSAFDFAYSLGVLHHLPDTGQGLAKLARHVRPGGTVITWLYAGGRGKWFERVEPLRRRVARLPLPVLYWLCFGIAALAYRFAIVPYRWLTRAGLGRRLLERFPAHFRYYADYPFRVYHADWVDRLSAPVRTYYQPAEARELLLRNGLAAVETYRTYETGVTAVGHVPAAEVGA